MKAILHRSALLVSRHHKRSLSGLVPLSLRPLQRRLLPLSPTAGQGLARGLSTYDEFMQTIVFSQLPEEAQRQEKELRLFDVVRHSSAKNLEYWLIQGMANDLEHQRLNINCCDNEQTTLLMLAVELGKTDMVRMLLDHGATVNLQNTYGDTALHFAARENHREIANLLLCAGAQADLKNYEGMTPAECARDPELDKIVRAREGLHCNADGGFFIF